MDVTDAHAHLVLRSSLWSGGVPDRALRDAVEGGNLHRIGRGTYVARPSWDELYREEQHLIAVAAAIERARDADLVFSHASAAVLHGLPLWGLRPQPVHVSGPSHDGNVGPLGTAVARHRVPLPDAHRTEIEGIAVTTLPRTVADILRTTPRACALAAADAALRLRAIGPTREKYDHEAAEALRAAIAALLRPGARGVRQARALLDLADGRAESPGESVSRLLLIDAGFRIPQLQLAVAGPYGSPYYVDFSLDDIDAWGEYDGEAKYHDPAMLSGRSLEAVLRDEKDREDWIRATTGRRLIRWSTADIRSPAAFQHVARRLRLSPNHS